MERTEKSQDGGGRSAERFQNVHDVKLQLKWIAEGGSQAGVPVLVAVRRKNGETLAWSLMSGFAIFAAAFAFWAYALPPSSGAGPVLAFVPPPRDTRFLAFGFGSGPAVVSPDETRLAFMAIDQNGLIKLWTRSLKANDATAVLTSPIVRHRVAKSVSRANHRTGQAPKRRC